MIRSVSVRRRAFTLVELLVVISIIGMLMALLLPAVQQAREAGRRNTCLNNMRNCALAVMGFAGAKGSYPGYVEPLSVQPVPNAGGGPAAGATSTQITYPVSWIVPVLPYLERRDIYDIWRDQDKWAMAGGTTTAPPQVYMDILNCPSNPPTLKTGSTPCAYVANGGMVDNITSLVNPTDWQANGVFFNRYPTAQVHLPPGATPLAATIKNLGPIVSTTQDYITVHDGSSLTLMLSENNYAPTFTVNFGFATASGFGQTPSLWGDPATSGIESQTCFVWWPDANPTGAMKINSQQVASAGIVYNHYIRPSSNHPTGVNVAFCDGHTRFISQDIDYTIYCLLMTPYGQLCNTPDTYVGIDPGTGTSSYWPSGQNNYGLLRNKPVDDSQIN